MGLFKPQAKITISVTTKCNIDCVYCYTNKTAHPRATIPIQFARIGISDFIEKYGGGRLRFFGAGEPTCGFSIIKELLTYARTIATEPISAEIQTNGVFSPSVADYLADNFALVYISWDGPPIIQNHYRPTIRQGETSPIVERNLRHLQRSTTLQVAARATIGRSNVFRQRDIVDYFVSLGISHVWTRPIFPPPVGESQYKNEVIDLATYTSEFLQAHSYAKDAGLFYGSFLMANFDCVTDRYCSAFAPYPLLTTDGYVSTCDNVLFGKGVGSFSRFIIGQWDEETRTISYFADRINALRRRNVNNMEHCTDCPIKHRCGGFCGAELLEAYGDEFAQNMDICNATKRIADAIGFSDILFQIGAP